MRRFLILSQLVTVILLAACQPGEEPQPREKPQPREEPQSRKEPQRMSYNNTDIPTLQAKMAMGELDAHTLTSY